MDMVESSLGRVDEGCWGSGVAVYFASLAAGTVLCPCTNIFVHIRPPEALCDEARGSFDARMRQIMELIEGVPSSV